MTYISPFACFKKMAWIRHLFTGRFRNILLRFLLPKCTVQKSRVFLTNMQGGWVIL